MRKSLFILAAILSLSAITALAAETTCESTDGRRKTCTMETRGPVRIIRQLSNSPCIEGQTWGASANQVWVSDGCRAVFASDDIGSFPGSGSLSAIDIGQATCESTDNRRKDCTINLEGRVSIIRQLSNSPCIEGKTWGASANQVWVSDGCRAVFSFYASDSNRDSLVQDFGSPSAGGPTQVTCESTDGRRKECAMNTRGGVRIIRQLSNSPCIEGKTWGASANQVWVSDGCRAVFVSDSTGSSRNTSRPPAQATRACSDFRKSYGRIMDSRVMRNGLWEITLRYDDGEFICTTSERGDISSFRKQVP